MISTFAVTAVFPYKERVAVANKFPNLFYLSVSSELLLLLHQVHKKNGELEEMEALKMQYWLVVWKDVPFA